MNQQYAAKVLNFFQKKLLKNLVYNINLFIFAVSFELGDYFMAREVYKINQIKINVKLQKQTGMETKEMSEKESLALITEMIDRTRRRLEIGDGNIFLYWGIYSLLIGALTYGMIWWTQNGVWQFLWFLVALGIFFIPRMQKKPAAKSYIDKASQAIWTSVIAILVVFTVVTFLFHIFGMEPGMVVRHWTIFYLYPFFIVGFGVLAQGVLIQEKSLIIGGIISMALGAWAFCICIDGFYLCFPLGAGLLMLDFIVMLVIPGLVIRHKAKKINERA